MPTTYGVDGVDENGGYVPKPLDVIVEEIEALQRATIDPLLKTDSDSVIGQLNGIYARQVAELWRVQEQLYYALSRKATGDALDIIGALGGTPRRGPIKSTTTLTIRLVPGTTVHAGSIVSHVGNPSVRVTTLADVTSDHDVIDDFEVQAQAETAGVVTAPIGALSRIETVISGWLSATNTTALTGGSLVEPDAAYNLRQLADVAAGNGGTLLGIAFDLRSIDGVTGGTVLENDTEATRDGMPPHSVEAIVQGGDTTAIAKVLWASRSAGVRLVGTETVTFAEVVGDTSVDRTVHFTRPTTVPIYVAIALTVDPAKYDGSSFDLPLRTAIVNATIDRNDPGFVDVGVSAYASWLTVTTARQPGVANAVVGVSTSPIAHAADGSYEVAIGPRQLAVFDVTRIVVEVTEL